MQEREEKKSQSNINQLSRKNLEQLTKKNLEDSTKQIAKSQQNVPLWAQTEKQLEKKEDEECNDLLDFIDNLDYDKYIDNLEVQNMLNSLKERVDKIKDEVEEQEKLEEELKE